MHLNLDQLMTTCEMICRVISDENVGRRNEKPTKAYEEFRYDLLKYAIFLADADGEVSETELQYICKKLNVSTEYETMESIKELERIPEGFITEIPRILNYTARADSMRLVENDLFYHQKAQLLLDLYKVFGENFLILFEQDVTHKASNAFTNYIHSLEKYLKEMGVFCQEKEKKYQIIHNGCSGITPSRIYGGSTISSERNYLTSDEQDEIDEYQVVYGNMSIKKGKTATTLEDKLEEFHNMIGLESVKNEVDSLVNLIRIQKLREEKGMKTVQTAKHMVFWGNPGTGKTTVARILASIYKDLGVLKTGHLVEVDRGNLVKGYMGQTAIQVKEVIDSALGGILFIDEAYTLTVKKGEGDYGQEAVDTLLKMMEDHRDNLIVIVAGYPDLMAEFLESNPGLKSRFNKFIDFEDYSVEEKILILEKMCEEQEYQLENGVKECLGDIFERREKEDGENSANARLVRNLLEDAISKQATRLIEMENPTKEDLSMLKIEDFS